jgi:hypothetical protein
MTTCRAPGVLLDATARATLILAWVVNIFAVVVVWRKMSTAPDGNVTAIFLIAVFGFLGMLILTWRLRLALARVR